MKKPEHKRRRPEDRYISDEQEEKAIATSEQFQGQHGQPNYNQRLRDGFRMLHYDE